MPPRGHALGSRLPPQAPRPHQGGPHGARRRGRGASGGRKSRGRGARKRRKERREREQSRGGMSRQDVELIVLMRDEIACMTDGDGGVVVWEGAWEEERRRRREGSSEDGSLQSGYNNED